MLADNHLAYRGTLADMCIFFGVAADNRRVKASIKDAIAALETNGFIKSLQDGAVWTLTLTRRAERKNSIIKIKREWYEVARAYHNPNNSLDWINLLKVWLYLIDLPLECLITSKQIADALDVSESVVKRVKSALCKDIGIIFSKSIHEKNLNGEYRCLGSQITMAAWIP